MILPFKTALGLNVRTFRDEMVMVTDLLYETIDRLDVAQARRDVMPFVKDQQLLALWSHDFFRDVASRLQLS